MTLANNAYMDQDEVKAALKEGIKEWMDEKFILIGKWTMSAFIAALVGALSYLILLGSGWQHKP